MSRSRSLISSAFLPTFQSSSGRLVTPHLVERQPTVGGVLAWKIQHSLTNYVARHLSGAAADAGDLPSQIAGADVELTCTVLNDGCRTRHGQRNVSLHVVDCCHRQPDDRA